jgi:hypothetical protein
MQNEGYVRARKSLKKHPSHNVTLQYATQSQSIAHIQFAVWIDTILISSVSSHPAATMVCFLIYASCGVLAVLA